MPGVVHQDKADRVFALVPIGGVGATPIITQKFAGRNVVSAHAITHAVNDEELIALQADCHGARGGEAAACVAHSRHRRDKSTRVECGVGVSGLPVAGDGHRDAGVSVEGEHRAAVLAGNE